MPLSETRIVMFEKAGFKKNFHELLDEIELQIMGSKKGNHKCVYVSARWLRHKLVKRILEQNGYTIKIGTLVRISWD